jgi:hypothetical protein
VKSKATKDSFKTNLENNSAVSIDPTGQVTIKYPRTINKIYAMESSINNPMQSSLLGRRTVSFTPWFEAPKQVTLYGYRYYSNPIKSIKDLFYFRLR